VRSRKRREKAKAKARAKQNICAYRQHDLRLVGNIVATSSSRPVDKRKLANLKITQARYQRANDIFVQSDDSD